MTSIAERVKKRSNDKKRRGRVGGTEHKKLIMLRKKQVEKRKNRKIEC